jgi:RNA polymerase sigma-70 factor (ECF subfamily)
MAYETDLLFARFHNSLKAFILRRVSDEDLANDLLQDVFLRIHSNIGSLKDSSRIQSWVYQIARNAIIDYYRSKKPNEELTELHHTTEGMQEEDAVRRLTPALRSMIDALPEPYKEALILTEIEGISQKELSVRWGISFSGAKSRVQRGRAMLREMLERCCHFEFDRYGTLLNYHEVGCCCCQAKKSS